MGHPHRKCYYPCKSTSTSTAAPLPPSSPRNHSLQTRCQACLPGEISSSDFEESDLAAWGTEAKEEMMWPHGPILKWAVGVNR